MVRLHEEADQHGTPLGHLEKTQAWDTRLRWVPGEGFLEILFEQRRAEAETAVAWMAARLAGQALAGLGVGIPGGVLSSWRGERRWSASTCNRASRRAGR